MKIGSLFSGIGGLELGLEWAGVGQTIWQVESDEFCRNILAEHWPDADRSVTDVRECTTGRLGSVDILCGGFPCQDISVAGNGAGLAGKRSGLWFEFARIIGEFRPRYVVVENVAALLVRGFDTVLGTLARLGYDAIWFSLRASDVGAPHKRERLFVVAYAHGMRASQPKRGVKKFGRWARYCGDVLADTTSERSEKMPYRIGDIFPPTSSNGWEIEPGMGRGAHGIPPRVDRWPATRGEEQKPWEPKRCSRTSKNRAARLKALGNAVVPQCAEIAGNVVFALDNWDATGG